MICTHIHTHTQKNLSAASNIHYGCLDNVDDSSREAGGSVRKIPEDIMATEGTPATLRTM